ncbi:hypothetical protein Dsin_022651 [Dipteronia sinensis]|uniref:Uncharacterized protein n=1 Tax=Dipteronia sinensis TaxID=43782 RepID=A0AAE0A3E5_9ROSI|nr:hypothetical protein Dsin_022651 [Dipteronia sinensis]
MASKNNKDHWAFLEEIEAPMWVDLTVEVTKSNSQNIDDDWFHTSHLFHQCSSKQLKAAFSCSWEENVDSNRDSLGQSSPKLPTSVSRSRGKDYKSKNWTGGNCNGSLYNPQPVKVLSGKSICTDLGSGEKIKPRTTSTKPKSSWGDSGSHEEIKPKLSFISRKGTSSSKSTLVTERSSSTKGTSLKPVSTFGSKNSSSSMVVKASKSSTASTITSESGSQPQQKFLATSRRALDDTSGLLSAVRITLRKSCVTRQASRVEINSNRRQSTMETCNDRRQSIMVITNDRKESRDRKSSSSKSSVGSSSLPGSSINSSAFVSTRKKIQTPDSRNVSRISKVTNRVKVSKSDVSKVSTVQAKERPLNSRSGDIPSVSKSKVPNQTLCAKSSLPLRVVEQNSSTGAHKAKEKVAFGGINRLAGGGKENATGKTSVSQKCRSRENATGGGKENATGKTSASQKCRSRENATGGIARGQNGIKQNAPQKVDTRGLAGAKGKISDRREGKSSTSVNQKRVFLR